MQLGFEGALVAMTTDANEKTQLRHFRVGGLRVTPHNAKVDILHLVNRGRNANDYYFSFGWLLPDPKCGRPVHSVDGYTKSNEHT
jgi:hypothetical protein